MKSAISMALWVLGGLLFLIALVFEGASIVSWVERSQHGPGLLFADVEFLGMIALFAAILGACISFVAKKLSAFEKREVPQHNPTDN